MPQPIFAPSDFKALETSNFLKDLGPLDTRRTAVLKWQKALAGRVGKGSETKFQSDFLNLFFGEILGYAYEVHEENWNLEKELKTEVDGKKPDGALGYFRPESSDVRAVIELKGFGINLDKAQNRTDFKGSPVEQAFSYAPKMGGKCAWVLVSNYEEIRLYPAANAGRCEVFRIPELLQNDNLGRFLLLLHKGRLFLETQRSVIEQRFENRQQELRTISVDFYRQYREKRQVLFNHLRQQNADSDPRALFASTQKLIDRLIFTCFVRDMELVSDVLDKVKRATKESFSTSEYELWQELRHLFRALDAGFNRNGTSIPAFNGGLFRGDDLLESLQIANAPLFDWIDFLRQYDFQSQLNVTILGHIFEQSISDIEEIVAVIENEVPEPTAPPGSVPPGVSKRKKDGIFYTPEYITQYMVKAAVGGWLDDRRRELLDSMGLSELMEPQPADYESITEHSANATIQLHRHYWATFREHLAAIRVLDPACGSGAFLTEVFDFLYQQWRIVTQELEKLSVPLARRLRPETGSVSLAGLDASGWATVERPEEWRIKKRIVQQNLFGVDLNAESVEITKLSLWLKTANRREALASLSDNIQRGNSLIDDPALAGPDAFDWAARFPEITAAGGFDVVVGNPPYLGGRDWKEEFGRRYDYFANQYEVADYQFDMYVLFWERSVKLTASQGYISLITPNTWLNNQSNLKLRTFILRETQVCEIADYSDVPVFPDAVVLPVVTTLKRSLPPPTGKWETRLARPGADFVPREFGRLPQSVWADDELKIFNINLRTEDLPIRQKIETGGQRVDELAVVKRGVMLYETGKGNPKQKPEDAKNNRYEADFQKDETWRKFLEGKDIQPYEINYQTRWVKYGDNLAAMREPTLFEGDRLLVRLIVGERLVCAHTSDDFVTSQLLQIVKPHDPASAKFLLGVLGSTLMAWYFRKKFNRLDKTFPEIRIYELASLPIRTSDEIIRGKISQYVENQLSLHHARHHHGGAFVELLQANFKLKTVSGKLRDWHRYEFGDLLAELTKAGATLTPAQQKDWLAAFKTEKVRLRELDRQIETTDRQIDALVYELYGLTEAEQVWVTGLA
ncbi:MAG: Eco57I restriction-modification methylase domain-containing protein [Cytophagaceae bacterium]|nr:Eco57I restriction-modification methylase domain-containing protein [Cytophagaceae bacterium]